MSPELKAVYLDEVERYDRLLIAAEDWSGQYKKDKVTFKKIIKVEGRLRRDVRGTFSTMADKIDQYIDWGQYYQQMASVKADSRLIADVNVDVVVNDDYYQELDSLFFTTTFTTISTAIATGAQAGENIYNIPLGIRSSDAAIQSLTTDRVAWLVGKRVDKSGAVVDNPKAEYRISDKTREDINNNIKTGIALGEDKQTITKRLQTVVNNQKRAETIAQTETVNAYGSGLLQFGRESQATGKEWQDVNATDICADNAQQGIIPLEDEFISGNTAPAAHTGCRCNLRIVYSNEYQP